MSTMNLITLDFGTIITIAVGLFLLGIAGRIAKGLARFSERLIIWLAQSGMPGVARAWLAILIGYDEYVYQRSRFEFRNQVGYRFSVFWGSYLALAVLLWVLHIDNRVDSISTAWIGLFITYIGFRSLLYWNQKPAPSPPQWQQDGQSFSPQVKERSRSDYRASPTFIRHWDYLDELFSNRP